MSGKLGRDMWQLRHPGAAKPAKGPDDDPLELVSYPCTFWANHLDIPSSPTAEQDTVAAVLLGEDILR